VATVNNCNIPEDLYYVIERHVWARYDGDAVTVGITDVAQNLAKSIVSVTPKKVGKEVTQGKSLATVESGKWVGAVPSPVSGAIIEVNQAAVSDPQKINNDPYGDGWIARLQPTDWEGESPALATGADGVETYRGFLDAEGIVCE
jgi:glycine cleavage system H protein